LLEPTDHDILDLHRVMFGEFLEWAGTTRRDATTVVLAGEHPCPGLMCGASSGIWGSLSLWIDDTARMDTEGVANVVADAHHRFQWITADG
jgi:fido (protein-threonine AMPylation protein)